MRSEKLPNHYHNSISQLNSSSSQNQTNESVTQKQDYPNYISSSRLEVQSTSIHEKEVTIPNNIEKIISLIEEEIGAEIKRQVLLGCYRTEAKARKYFSFFKPIGSHLPTYHCTFNDIVKKISQPLEEILLTPNLSDNDKLEALITLKNKINTLNISNDIKSTFIALMDGIYNYYSIEIEFKNCFVDTSAYHPLYKLLIENDVLTGKFPEYKDNTSRFIYENEIGYLYTCSKILLNLMNHTMSGKKITTDSIIELASSIGIRSNKEIESTYCMILPISKQADINLNQALFFGRITYINLDNLYPELSIEDDDTEEERNRKTTEVLNKLKIEFETDNTLYRSRHEDGNTKRIAKYKTLFFVDSQSTRPVIQNMKNHDNCINYKIKDCIQDKEGIETIIIAVTYPENSFDKRKQIADDALNSYYELIENTTNPRLILEYTIDVCCIIQRFHLLGDGNGRFAMGLLNALLYNKGYYLTATIDNWYNFDLKTPKENSEYLINYLVKAPELNQERWEKLIDTACEEPTSDLKPESKPSAITKIILAVKMLLPEFV